MGATEEKIGQPIVIEISYPYPAAHVGIFIGNEIDRVVLGDRIVEMNAGYLRVQLRKEGIRMIGLLAR